MLLNKNTLSNLSEFLIKYFTISTYELFLITFNVKETLFEISKSSEEIKLSIFSILLGIKSTYL